MTNWEYSVIPMPDPFKESAESEQKRLLDMQSKEGWELVSVVFLKAERSFKLIAYFKREKKSP
jgi:hypothetical protein